MINKILTSAVTGAVLISAILIYGNFNPLHNQHWLIAASVITATSTLVAELATKKNPQTELRQLLKRNLKHLPSGSTAWQPTVDLLLALRENENQDF